MKRSGLFVVVICIIVSTGSAEAELIEFEFGGEVTFAEWIFVEQSWNQVQVGDMWSISYVFDSTTPDTFSIEELQEQRGTYVNAIMNYELAVGGVTVFDSSDSGVGYVNIFNGYPTGWDQYEVSIDISKGEMSAEWFMQLDDPTDSALSTDALPLCGDIELDNFAVKDFMIFDIMNGVPAIIGTVDYHNCRVVPEPATLSLLALGAFFAGRKRRV